MSNIKQSIVKKKVIIAGVITVLGGILAWAEGTIGLQELLTKIMSIFQ